MTAKTKKMEEGIDFIQTCKYLREEVIDEAWQIDRQTLEEDILIPVFHVLWYFLLFKPD